MILVEFVPALVSSIYKILTEQYLSCEIVSFDREI